MTRSQKLALRQSELRQKVSALLDTELEKRSEFFDDDLGKLTREMRSLESELQAALLAEPAIETRSEPDAEGRELRDLAGRASVGNIFAGVLEHRSQDGAEDEIQKHYGLNANQIPLAMLRGLETRAVTPAPANVGQNQAEVIPYVFPMSCAAFLGVDMPTVPVGEAVYPVLVTPASVETLAENAAGTETTGSFSAEVLTPGRLQASFFYSREDRARFAGMDAALRQNLTEALMDGLDAYVLGASGTGFLGTGLANPTNPETAADFEAYRNLVYGRIDGRYANMATDVRLVVGHETYSKMANVYRSNNADDSALDSVMRVSGGVKVSSHIPAAASTIQGLIAARGMARNAVAPIWEGVTLIPDEVTKAANGQIVLTAVLLFAFKVLRADGYARLEVKLS